MHFTWSERKEEQQGTSIPQGPEVDVHITWGTTATFDLIEGRRVWVMKDQEQQFFFW